MLKTFLLLWCLILVLISKTIHRQYELLFTNFLQWLVKYLIVCSQFYGFRVVFSCLKPLN